MTDSLDTSVDCSAKIEKFVICRQSKQKLYGNPVMSKHSQISLWRNQLKELVLTVTAAKGKLAKNPLNLNLKKAKIYHKFVNEGKMTIESDECESRIFISNAPPRALNNFASLMVVKLENTQTPPKPNKSVLGRASLTGGGPLDQISPLCDADIRKVNLKRQRKQQQQQQQLSGKPKRKLPFTDLSNTQPSKKPALAKLLKNPFDEKQTRLLTMIRSGVNVFYTGGAGTGKTYLLKHAIGFLSPASTYITASTGVAACHVGGVTLHSFAGMGKGSESPQRCLEIAMKRKDTVKRWRTCKTLIIDEVSMVSASFFDKLEYLARAIRGDKKPFGGIQVILCGDFYQLPPVERHEKGTSHHLCFNSAAWSSCAFQILELTRVYRQVDPVFVNCLRRVRTGDHTEEDIQLLLNTQTNEVDKDGIVATHLCTHRKDVDEINCEQLELLGGDEQVYRARDQNGFFSSFIDRLLPETVRVVLKIGAQVMLVKNLNPSKGLVNGSRGVVTAFYGREKCPVVKFLSGHSQLIAYEKFSVSCGRDVQTHREQVPLKLAWAISIHKSQGMTIDCVTMDLSRAFEPGQAYVALSRVRSLACLKLVDFNAKCIKSNSAVKRFHCDYV